MTTATPEINFNFDPRQVLQWRNGQSEKFNAWVGEQFTWIQENYTDFWQNWYTDVLNLTTANAFGLAVWAIILGMPNLIDTTENEFIFRFDNPYNFDNGYFDPNAGSITLSVQELRIALQLRYYKLNCNGALPQTNEFLNFVFSPYGAKSVFLFDNAMSQVPINLTITYIFKYPVSVQMLNALRTYDLLPRDTCVKINFQILNTSTFNLDNPQNFDNGFFGD